MRWTFDSAHSDGEETRASLRLSLGAVLLVLAGLGLMMVLDEQPQADPHAGPTAAHQAHGVAIHTAAANHGG